MFSSTWGREIVVRTVTESTVYDPLTAKTTKETCFSLSSSNSEASALEFDGNVCSVTHV